MAGVFRFNLLLHVAKYSRTYLEIMARSSCKVLSVAAALVALYNVCNSWSFVPGPLRKHAPVAAASAAGMMMAPAAFADEIGDAAKKLGDASYDFAKEVDWNNGIFLQAPGKFQPLEALKAIDKMIEMGAAADPKLLKAAAEAHHKAIGSISGPNGVTSRADWDAVNAALGRVVASVPKAKVMDVYNAVKDITDPGVPAYMKSLVNGADAEKAYQGFLEFKDVVEKKLLIRFSVIVSSLSLQMRLCGSIVSTGDDTLQYICLSLKVPQTQVQGTKWPQLVLLPPCPLATRLASPQRLFQMHPYPFLKEVQGY